MSCRGLLIAVVLAMLVSACSEPAERVERVRLSGEITAPAAASTDGTVYVNLYHAWALEGELRHPVEFIGSFETRLGAYSHEFDYPIDLGQGLLVYAWLDEDGDGVLCTPVDQRAERAGLAEVESFQPGDVRADVALVAPCAGADWFYPVPVD